MSALKFKFKLFLLACAILLVVSTFVLNWTTFQSGKQEGLKEGEEGLLLSKKEAEEQGLVFYLDTFISAPTCIIFCGDSNTEIGRLEWGTGKFVFVGEAEESAIQFFEHFLKAYVDAYIASNLEKK